MESIFCDICREEGRVEKARFRVTLYFTDLKQKTERKIIAEDACDAHRDVLEERASYAALHASQVDAVSR